MNPRDFLSDRLYQIVLHFACMLALSIFLLTTGTSRGVIFLILIIWLLGLAAVLVIGCVRTAERLRELDALMEGLDKKYLFAECAPLPRSRYEQRLFSLMRRSGRAMTGAVSDAEAMQRDYREYIENWVHEIKAPITSAKLMCRNDDSASARRLELPLAEIEAHVERALYYARAGSVERDFAITETSLSKVVGPAIARLKALLIHSGIRIETDNLDEIVYTDGKWAAFILGQLLSNAARYCEDSPMIRISAKRLGQFAQLRVWDNGIGIPACDLPRIFDKGFTGSNGRARGTATGMGLYIVKTLAEHLQIEISASSAIGEYTEFILTFPAKDNLSKL